MPTIRSWARRLAVVAALAIPAGARADTPRPVTEAAFIAEVVAAAPERALATARTAAATAAIATAALRANPLVGWEHDELPGTSRLDRVAVTVPLDLSPGRAARRRAAAADAEAAAADAGQVERALAIAAARVYLEAAAARQLRLLLEEARGPVAALAEQIAAQAAAGAASGYDADRVALELAIVDDELATARGAERATAAALAAWLADGDAPVEAIDPVSLPLAPPPIAIAPTVGAAAATRATARAADAASHRRPWAAVELTAGVLYERGPAERTLGFTLGLTAPLPVFDGGGAATRAAHAAAAAERAEAGAARTAATRAAAAAHAALLATLAQAAAHRQGPGVLAARLVAAVEVAYREGDRSLLELLDALRATRAAAVRQLDLTRAARRAALDLAAAQAGVP